MWRYVLPGAGVVGLTVLLLAGSFASWSFGGGGAPPRQGAPPATVPATMALTTPASAADPSAQPMPSAATSEEDAVRLALSALAYVPPASLPSVSAPAALPPAASPPLDGPPGTAAPIAAHKADKSAGEANNAGGETEDLNQQSLAAARAGRVFVSRALSHGVEGRAR
ncbi:MAG: hypothetical protein JOY66_16755 [Acetobacteraceae bacterium]|nr:hypothetical protein [Acetobacteraceae bacterium]